MGFHCPECLRAGSARQRVFTAARMRQLQRPYVTLALVAVNAVVFLLDLLVRVEIVVPGGIIREGRLAWEGQLWGPNVAAGDWWRPITVGFVHGSVMHVGFNMLVLYLMGERLERALGRISFLALFALSLLGGSALILIVDPLQRTVGASGAIFGLLGAAAVGIWLRGANPFETPVGMLLALGLGMTAFAFVVPGARISVAGHVGGLLAGAAGGLLLFGLGDRMRGGKAAATAICALAALALFFLCLEIPEARPWDVLPSA